MVCLALPHQFHNSGGIGANIQIPTIVVDIRSTLKKLPDTLESVVLLLLCCPRGRGDKCAVTAEVLNVLPRNQKSSKIVKMNEID